MNANSSTTIADWLRGTESRLKAAGIGTARLDSLVLLSDELGHDKTWLLAHSEEYIQGSVLKILSTKITQRTQHIPLAYIRGCAEFYGREFAVDEHVLVPRPESEAMIELLKVLAEAEQPANVIDIGTGSGALAITAKLEVGSTTVYASDIDRACLNIAARNAEHCHAEVTFLHGDLLQPFVEKSVPLDQAVVMANLPYVPDAYSINEAARHEPATALFAGVDGLELYRRLFAEIAVHKHEPRAIITESLQEQHDALTDIASHAGYGLNKTDGLAQLFLRKT